MINSLFPYLPAILLRQNSWVSDFFKSFCLDEGDDFESFYTLHPQNAGRLHTLLEIMRAGEIPVGCFAGAGVSKAYDIPTWSEFLAEAGRRLEKSEFIAADLAAYRYPEVAQTLEDLDPVGFENVIRDTFSHKKMPDQFKGVGGMLTFFPFKYLITTNFDYVLEGVYQLSGMVPKPIIYGGNSSFASAAYAEGLLPLLKIHGDTLHGRVLTSKQYESSYAVGSALTDHLVQLFSTASWVFVGFSLQDKEIREALRKAKDIAPDLPHFAILPADSPEEARQRDASFLACGVYPIWYSPPHEFLAKLLAHAYSMLYPDLELWKLGFAFQHEAFKYGLAVCEELIQLRPRCRATKQAYAQALAFTIDYGRLDDLNYVDAAISRIDRAIGTVDDFPDAYAIRAIMGIQRLDIAGAIADMTRSIELDSSVKEMMRMLRGMIYLFIEQQPELAQADFETARQNISVQEEVLKPLAETLVEMLRAGHGDRAAIRRLDHTLERWKAESPEMALAVAENQENLENLKKMHRFGVLKGFVEPSRVTKFFIKKMIWAGRAGILLRKRR